MYQKLRHLFRVNPFLHGTNAIAVIMAVWIIMNILFDDYIDDDTMMILAIPILLYAACHVAFGIWYKRKVLLYNTALTNAQIDIETLLIRSSFDYLLKQKELIESGKRSALWVAMQYDSMTTKSVLYANPSKDGSFYNVKFITIYGDYSIPLDEVAMARVEVEFNKCLSSYLLTVNKMGQYNPDTYHLTTLASNDEYTITYRNYISFGKRYTELRTRNKYVPNKTSSHVSSSELNIKWETLDGMKDFDNTRNILKDYRDRLDLAGDTKTCSLIDEAINTLDNTHTD